MHRSDAGELREIAPKQRSATWLWLLLGGLLFVVVGCISCAGGTVLYHMPRNATPEFLIGTWQHTGWLTRQTRTYEFRADGTGRLTTETGVVIVEDFKYTLHGTDLTLDFVNIDFGGELVLAGHQGRRRVWRSGGGLTMENVDGDFRHQVTFTRLK